MKDWLFLIWLIISTNIITFCITYIIFYRKAIKEIYNLFLTQFVKTLFSSNQFPLTRRGEKVEGETEKEKVNQNQNLNLNQGLSPTPPSGFSLEELLKNRR